MASSTSFSRVNARYEGTSYHPLVDPVGKNRVSTPQSLIDTDFEYGTQPTKWETLQTLNFRPTLTYDVTTPYNVTGVSGIGTSRVVTVTSTANPGVGALIYVQETLDSNASGFYVAETSSGSNFTYVGKGNIQNGSIFDNTKTYVYPCVTYINSAIPISSVVSSGAVVTVTTVNDHGLTVGDGIAVTGTTSASNPPNGGYVVETTNTNTQFTFTANVAPSGTITAGANNSIYARPFGFVAHRPFDGGVQFSSGTTAKGYQAIRQTRKYFRYQSGKGIQFSTGTILKPSLTIDNITSSGTTVTVTSKYKHNINAGALVTVVGSTDPAYNGTFVVASVPNDTTFTYTAASAPTISPAVGFPNIIVSPQSWYGSNIRIGMFDDQNGLFFEYDGQILYAVRRSSTTQITGRTTCSNFSQSVTGVGTKFSAELKPGDSVVIRGSSYKVVSITSDTQMYIYPEFKGPTTGPGVIISKTIDDKYPQSSWNIDRCDGTGLSGFNLDLTRMQMLYIDYSWYGAGAARFGFKDHSGQVFYVHNIPNANYRIEAYMRSGNLPARYESGTITPSTYLTATLSSAATVGSTISVADTSLFPASGNVIIKASGATNASIEYISYSAKTPTSLTISARGLVGGTTTPQTFTYSATAPIEVQTFNQQASATLSHWGSSVIMDGRFDNDKSYIFQGGFNNPISIPAGGNTALMAIRLAPSVDSGITGALGARELINRMQLTLNQTDMFVTGTTNPALRVELILNGKANNGTFQSVGGSSLAQVAYLGSGANTYITGGETIFSFFAGTGITQQELSTVRDLGNSILGGGNNNVVPATTLNVYPDGPDIITFKVTNISTAASNITARISWTEAQA